MANKIKATIKVPRRAVDSAPNGITMFSTIEYNVEGTTDEIEHIYQEVMSEGGDGLNKLEWAQLRNRVYREGVYDPDMQETFSKCSKLQKHVLNELKLAQASLKIDEQDNHINQI